MGTFINGTITLSGTPQAGVTVRLINNTNDTYEGETTTDSNGVYQFTGLISNEKYQIVVEYDDGTTKYNAVSDSHIELTTV